MLHKCITSMHRIRTEIQKNYVNIPAQVNKYNVNQRQLCANGIEIVKSCLLSHSRCRLFSFGKCGQKEVFIFKSFCK